MTGRGERPRHWPSPHCETVAADVVMSDEAAASRGQEARRILEDSGAILHGGHFGYISGDHGDGWIDKDAIFPHTERVSRLAELLAAAIGGREIDVVCGPATGGLIVSQWTAHHLGLPSVFAEHGKEHGYDPRAAQPGPLRPPFVLKRGYDRLVAGKRVLVVDDVINTGESVAETGAAVKAAGGQVATVAAICSRGNAGPAEVRCNDYVWLVEVQIPSWPAADCELCRRGVPINTRFAHGADFLAAQQAV
jgi:orotate phosphoribosyltransferase